MKAIVRKELERERYVVVEEPPCPPKRAPWVSYRPGPPRLQVRRRG
jgi:hypothetical protein